MEGMIENDHDDAFCSVAKVSPSLLQRLGCQCWDVVHISLHHHTVTAASAAATETAAPSSWSTGSVNPFMLPLLTSFLVQVIPDDQLTTCSSSASQGKPQVYIHSVLLDFLHAAATAAALESSSSSSSSVSRTNSAPPPHREQHPNDDDDDDDDDDDSQQSAPASIDVQLASVAGGGHSSSLAQDDDHYDYQNDYGHLPQQYQWRIQKATAADIRQLDDGSTLGVQCVYSDAPIRNHDDDSFLFSDDNNGSFCCDQNDVAAALQDKLVQKGCILLLPIVAVHADAHHPDHQPLARQRRHEVVVQRGYVIVRIHDIQMTPPLSPDDHHQYHHDVVARPQDDNNTVYRLGTLDSFRLSFLASSSSASHLTTRDASTIRSSGGQVLESHGDDGSHTDTCPGYESLQQQLIQLLDPASSSSSSTVESSSFSSCRPTGVLLTGSVGVGKTQLARCVARQLSCSKNNVHYISLSDLWMDGGMSSTTVPDLKAALLPPFTNVLMLDDLHILATAEDGTEQQDTMDRQLLQSALLQVMDTCVEQGIPCLGIASTEWKLLPTMLVKFGRLERHLEMSSPTQHQRELILRQQLSDIMMLMMTPGSVDYNNIEKKVKHWASILAPLTAGCVAADLCRLCHNAQMRSWARQQQDNDNDNDDMAVWSSLAGGSSTIPTPPLLWEDLREAAQELVPFQLATLDVIKPEPPALPLELYDESAAILTGNSSSPLSTPRNDSNDWLAIHEQSWCRLAGYADVKKRVYRTIVAPWRRFLKHEHQKHKHSNKNDEIGDDMGNNDDQRSHEKLLVPPPTGVIFHGASGCGKSLAATSLGASLEWSMIHVNVATDILDQWLGGSEAALRLLFARARAAAPCILFLDEMDAIACNRNSNDSGDSTNVMSRLLSTLLNEMDGIGGSSTMPSKVLVVACTNQSLHSIDAALLRPGRLDHHIELKTPVSLDDAVAILQLYLTRKQFASIDQRKDEQASPAAAGAAACPHSLLHDEVDLRVVAARALHQGPKLNEVTGASLEGLARQAILSALRRSMEEGDSKGHDTDEVIVQVTMQDFDEAMLSRV